MEGKLWRQYVIAGVANIASASTGYSMGWTSPINIKLRDPDLTDSPLPAPITTNEEAWIGSLIPLGCLLGTFIAGPLTSRIGRKWSLLACSIPLLAGWIFIAIATSVAYLYAGRFMFGVGLGMVFTASPMYCAEIATNDSRGALGSFLNAFITLGYLLVYSIGPFISYSAVAYVGLGFVAAFVIFFFFMPESPYYHLTKSDREAAAKSLMTIRGQSRSGVEAELELMASDVAASMSKTASLAEVFRGSNFKAFYIACALMFFQQFSGINAVLFYMANIFEAAGSDLDSSISTIIIGAVQVGASFVTPLVVDRLGRRVLLLISTCGTTIGLTFLGMYFLLDALDSPVVPSISFLPILSLMVFMITYCVGLGPLPMAVLGELFPIEVKAKAAPIVTAFCSILSFLVTRYFGPISNVLGMYASFWIFGVCCLVAFFFALFFMPETKGKSFSEIQEMLSGKPSKEKA